MNHQASGSFKTMDHAGNRLISRRAAIKTAAMALAALPLMRRTSRGSFLAVAEMIEEDWTLIIANPDKTNHAPGIKMIISSPSRELLDTTGETLTWTQRLKLSNGNLTFSLRNTKSETWDSASGEILSVSTACDLADLSGYDPLFSALQSGPTWWPDRVTSLVMTAVRYYDAMGGLILTDPTDRAAYP
jgi:hypothetical protein